MTDQNKRDDALLPCPFCGEEQPPHDDTSWVRCLGCGVETGWQSTGAKAIAAWNTRALPTLTSNSVDDSKTANPVVNDPAAIRNAALREAYDVVYKWWFSDGNELPQELILALIGEKK